MSLCTGIHQAKFHGPANAPRLHIIERLRVTEAAALVRLSEKIDRCGFYAAVWLDEATGFLCRSQARCKSRLCPTCGRIRAGLLKEQLLEVVKHIDRPRFLTLTLKSTAAPLEVQLRTLRKHFAALRRTKAWAAHVKGGVATIEVTYNAQEDAWHPHVHAIVEGAFWRQAEIANLWEKITKTSRIVDIREVPGQRQIVNYIVKYVAKTQTPVKMPQARFIEWARETHGARLVSAFGRFHGRLPNGDGEEKMTQPVQIGMLEPLAEAAALGDAVARGLYNAVITLPRRPAPGTPADQVEVAAARHREITGLLRDWYHAWNNRHAQCSTQGLPTTGPPNSTSDRTERLWQEPVDSTSPCRH